jgi:hypothetical protein
MIHRAEIGREPPRSALNAKPPSRLRFERRQVLLQGRISLRGLHHNEPLDGHLRAVRQHQVCDLGIGVDVSDKVAAEQSCKGAHMGVDRQKCRDRVDLDISCKA